MATPDQQPETKTFTVRAGSAGEALVTAPSGRVEFMGFWKFFKFVIAASLEAHKAGTRVKFEVQHD